ncbi:MAG: hypothetical protein ACR2QH_18770, partial [Geminicoccaceae bacterium]
MITQIDEKQLAMIALSVHPAGEADHFVLILAVIDVGGAQAVAMMGAIGMHGLFSQNRRRHESSIASQADGAKVPEAKALSSRDL